MPTKTAPGAASGRHNDGGNLSGRARADHAYQIRVEAARREREVPIPAHPTTATKRVINIKVHWRTDACEAVLLGEQVAISMLRDIAETYSENFNGFR